jgi:hypothetical protein
VSLGWFPWTEDKGTVSDLASLSGRIWIRPCTDNHDKPLQPVVSGVVEIIPLAKEAEKDQVVQVIVLPTSAIKLTYIK